MTSLSVSPDGKLLLSAGQVIKMWDLDTKEVYRVSVRVVLPLCFLFRSDVFSSNSPSLCRFSLCKSSQATPRR